MYCLNFMPPLVFYLLQKLFLIQCEKNKMSSFPPA